MPGNNSSSRGQEFVDKLRVLLEEYGASIETDSDSELYVEFYDPEMKTITFTGDSFHSRSPQP